MGRDVLYGTKATRTMTCFDDRKVVEEREGKGDGAGGTLSWVSMCTACSTPSVPRFLV